jgi:hypothetical protein
MDTIANNALVAAHLTQAWATLRAQDEDKVIPTPKTREAEILAAYRSFKSSLDEAAAKALARMP